MIWAGIGQGFAAAIVYFLAVLVVLRALARIDPMFTVLASALAAYVAMLFAFPFAGQAVNFWVFSTSYWFFALCFLMAFGAVYKSVSLQILLQLSQQPDRSERTATLRTQYVFGRSFQDRLALIVDRRLATENPDGLSLTASGNRLARRARAVQRAFGVMRSG